MDRLTSLSPVSINADWQMRLVSCPVRDTLLANVL